MTHPCTLYPQSPSRCPRARDSRRPANADQVRFAALLARADENYQRLYPQGRLQRRDRRDVGRYGYLISDAWYAARRSEPRDKARCAVARRSPLVRSRGASRVRYRQHGTELSLSQFRDGTASIEAPVKSFPDSRGRARPSPAIVHRRPGYLASADLVLRMERGLRRRLGAVSRAARRGDGFYMDPYRRPPSRPRGRVPFARSSIRAAREGMEPQRGDRLHGREPWTSTQDAQGEPYAKRARSGCSCSTRRWTGGSPPRRDASRLGRGRTRDQARDGPDHASDSRSAASSSTAAAPANSDDISTSLRSRTSRLLRSR